MSRADRESLGAVVLRAARDDLIRRWRATSGRGRKLRGLILLLSPYRGRVALMFVSLIIATAAALAPPPLAKLAIDSGIVPKDLTVLTWVVVAFLVSALAYWGATYAQTYLVGWIGQRALQDLRIQLFEHLQGMSVGFYSRKRAGVLISRMSNDVEALDTLVSDGIVTLFGSSLTLIGTAAILFTLDPELALITYTVFPVLGIASFAFRIVSADAYRATREKVAAITAYLQETLSGIRVVRTFAQEPRHLRRFEDLNEENRHANMKTVHLNAAYFPGVELLSGIATAGILFYGGIQAVNGEITIGVLVAFLAALNNFFDPIQQLCQLYTTYQSGMAALDKIFELLDEEPDLVDAPDAIVLPRLRGEIELDDVSFSYGGDAYALRDVSLHVPPGQTVALVGTTGAGKSTFAKLVARFYDPTSGSVRVDGHDLRGVTGGFAAVPDGDRAAGGVPVQRHDRRRTSRSAARTPQARKCGRRPRPWVPTTSSPGWSMGTTRRSGSVASSSRPGSASSSRSRARWSPTPGSSSWTRPLRTSMSIRSPRSRPACGGCSRAGPRSSSRTGSPRSSGRARSS